MATVLFGQQVLVLRCLLPAYCETESSGLPVSGAINQNVTINFPLEKTERVAASIAKERKTFKIKERD